MTEAELTVLAGYMIDGIPALFQMFISSLVLIVLFTAMILISGVSKLIIQFMYNLVPGSYRSQSH